MLKLLDIVTLKKENCNLGITTECLGAIVDVLVPGKLYSVEFMNANGETIESSLFTEFKEDDLILQQSFSSDY